MRVTKADYPAVFLEQRSRRKRRPPGQGNRLDQAEWLSSGPAPLSCLPPLLRSQQQSPGREHGRQRPSGQDSGKQGSGRPLHLPGCPQHRRADTGVQADEPRQSCCRDQTHSGPPRDKEEPAELLLVTGGLPGPGGRPSRTFHSFGQSLMTRDWAV